MTQLEALNKAREEALATAQWIGDYIDEIRRLEYERPTLEKIRDITLYRKLQIGEITQRGDFFIGEADGLKLVVECVSSIDIKICDYIETEYFRPVTKNNNN